MTIRLFLTIPFFLLFQFVFCQEQSRLFVAQVEMAKIIEPIDTLIDHVVYHKKDVSHFIGDFEDRNSGFFIDIPIGLEFYSYKRRGRIVLISFSNLNEETIIVEVHPCGEKVGVVTFNYSKKGEQATPPVPLNEEIPHRRFAGFYHYDKYVVYFFNVSEERLVLFEESAKSIRN